MRRAFIGLALAMAATPALAQDPGSRQTREFVQAASQSDMFEMLEGQTVVAYSTDPGVRAFAQMMIRDHGATTTALLDAAAKAGLAPPAPGISNDQAEFLAALQSAQGRDFDRVYARQQVLAHHAALVTQRDYAATGDASAVRRAATTAVPIVSGHLAMAERLKAQIGE